MGDENEAGRIESDDIRVYDGRLSPALMSDVFSAIHQPVYKFGQKSNPGDAFGFWIAMIDDEVLRQVPPLRELWRLTSEELGEGRFERHRMYVNAYNYGDCPTVHQDHRDEGHFTVLYYANLEWHYDWSGETVFFNSSKDEIRSSVYPRPGRIVVFDGRIPHVAREPSRLCPFVRYTIALKLKLRAS